MQRFYKAILFSPLLKSNLSVNLSIKTWSRSFNVFRVHKYSTHFYNCIDLIMLLYKFLVISFDWYKEQTICLILFNNFSELLPAFTCATAIGNLWSIFFRSLYFKSCSILFCFILFCFINSFRSNFCIIIK